MANPKTLGADPSAAIPFPGTWFTNADALDGEWSLFYDGGELPADPASLRALPACIRREGREIRPVKVRLGELTDLNKVLGVEPKIGRECLLARVVESDADALVHMGTFADWWVSLHVNGELVDTTWPEGSEGAHYSHFNHIFPVRLRKGGNLLVLRVRSGLVTWWADCGFVPLSPMPFHDTRLYSRRAISDYVCPGSPRVKHGPYVTRLVEDSAVIAFQSDGPMAAAVDYREKGAADWRRVIDAADTIPYTDLDAHAVALAGLAPGREYEYRVVLFPTAQAEPVVAPAEAPWPVFRTRNAAVREYDVLAISDTQTDPGRRLDTIGRTLQAVGGAARFDFIAVAGDVTSYCDNFEQEVLESFDLFRPTPIVPVPGNHEHCGRESGMWARYFAPDGHFFFAFRHGPVFWFALHNGNDFLDRYGDLNSLLIERERAWLMEVVATEECREAPFRNVIIHHAPVFNTEPNPMRYGGLDALGRRLADGIFLGDAPLCRTDLWLVGHTHHYLRSIPGTDRFFAREIPGGVDYSGFRLLGLDNTLPFTAVTAEDCCNYAAPSFSGTTVHVSPEALDVSTIRSDGILLDRFRIRADHTVENLERAPDVQEVRIVG